MRLLHLTVAIGVTLFSRACMAGDACYVEVRRYDAPEATQAVAVDEHHFYAITNAAIAKYDRQTGQLVSRWQADEDTPLTHLNSGIIYGDRLYCAHSNYPEIPEASSIEIWDTRTMTHIDTHSLGVYEGSLTWVARDTDGWWAVFAHYSTQQDKNPLAKSHRWTSLVRFDTAWRRQSGWIFPDEVLERFAPYSCSGGGWGPDGALYCTGHDRGEVYRLTLPQAGSTLRLTATLPAPVTGQGIAWEPDGRQLWGIDRPKRQVIVCRLDSND
jgi:hypothetical protein